MRRCAVVLVAAVMASGCTSGENPESTSDQPHTYDLGSGAQLVSPAGALPDDVRVSGEPVTEPLVDLAGFPSAGSVDVSTSDQPDEPVTIEIPVDPAAYADLPSDGDDAVLVAHRHGAEDWEALAGRLDRERGVVSVSTDQLSVFDVRLPSLSDLRRQVGDILNGVLGGADFTPDPPQCARESEARDAGYTVTSTRTTVLQWCLGLRPDGSPELKVVGSRRYPLVTEYGRAFNVRSNTAGELGVRLAQSATNALTSGQVTLAPGGTATLDVRLDAGRSGQLVADFDGFAQSLVSLQMGADVMVQLAKLTRGGAGASEFMDATLDAAACAPKLLDLAFDVEDPGRVGSAFAACFDPDAITNRLGNILGHFVLTIVNFIGSVIAYVWTSATALVDQVRGDSSYTVTVQRAAPRPAPAPQPVLTPTGFGAVTFGSTVAQAGDALGQPLTSDGGSCWNSAAFPDVAFVVRNGSVVAAGVNRAPSRAAPSVRTDRGVTLESSRADVLAAYPGMTTRTSSGDAYTDLLLWDDGTGGMVQILYGTEPGDGMFSLFAGDKDVVQFEELCAG